MPRVHIVTEGFVSPNGRSFLYPFLRHRRTLSKHGVQYSISSDASAAIPDCDVLLLDSKRFSGGWGHNTDRTLALFAGYRRNANRLIFVDNTDSAGWINGAALTATDRYWKASILSDRTLYTRPLYGRRVYADYYHHRDGVSDPTPDDAPQIRDPSHLNNIAVHWNSGLADYSLYGPKFMRAYQTLPLSVLLREPTGFADPSAAREVDLSCRMGMTYARNTVAHQRRLISAHLGMRIRTGKLGRRQYFREMQRSRIVLSPFGLGEITLKDFEVFIAGALLLKPDMSHMETWPEFYRPGHTMLTHAWDLSDLDAVIDRALADPSACIAMAERAQRLYRHHLTGPTSAEAFSTRLLTLLSP